MGWLARLLGKKENVPANSGAAGGGAATTNAESIPRRSDTGTPLDTVRQCLAGIKDANGEVREQAAKKLAQILVSGLTKDNPEAKAIIPLILLTVKGDQTAIDQLLAAVEGEDIVVAMAIEPRLKAIES